MLKNLNRMSYHIDYDVPSDFNVAQSYSVYLSDLYDP